MVSRERRKLVNSARVRSAQSSDLEACVELALVASREPTTSADAWRGGLTADIHEPDRLLLVAEIGTEIVGYGRVRTFEPGLDAPPETAPAGFYLLGLFVQADFRRRGVGLALTSARMRWIAERADEAWFFSNARNAASIALHRRLGFEEVTRRFSFPGVTFAGGDGVLFRAHLADRP
jgi:ribosomal protein S18 acetylase RimI-like enzyme